MGEVSVDYCGGDRFAIDVRGHRLEVDQPIDEGGEDSAPTPVELFVSSLAACVAHYARRYLSRHELPTDGLAVNAHFSMATDRPARVGLIDIRLHLPQGIPSERLAPLLAVARHCTVHNTLEDPPQVVVALDGEVVAA